MRNTFLTPAQPMEQYLCNFVITVNNSKLHGIIVCQIWQIISVCQPAISRGYSTHARVSNASNNKYVLCRECDLCSYHTNLSICDAHYRE